MAKYWQRASGRICVGGPVEHSVCSDAFDLDSDELGEAVVDFNHPGPANCGGCREAIAAFRSATRGARFTRAKYGMWENSDERVNEIEAYSDNHVTGGRPTELSLVSCGEAVALIARLRRAEEERDAEKERADKLHDLLMHHCPRALKGD